MPGISATVADEIEALRKVGGEAAVALIRSEPDPKIDALVSTWPKAFNAELALALGFVPDQNFDEIVAIYREDELGLWEARHHFAVASTANPRPVMSISPDEPAAQP
jgi:hypothetical protein